MSRNFSITNNKWFIVLPIINIYT